MKIRLLLAGALVAAGAASFAPSASAVECPPPVMSTACWAWGTVCRQIPQGEVEQPIKNLYLDPHALLCTVAA